MTNQHKYKSKFEEEVANYYGKNVLYEPEVLTYLQPEIKKKYSPDFITTNKIYLETKGYWSLEDRKRHIWIREQHPDKRIIMIFQNSNNTLTKKSKITYADWCDKHNIEYYCWRTNKPPKTIKGLLNGNQSSSRNTLRPA